MFRDMPYLKTARKFRNRILRSRAVPPIPKRSSDVDAIFVWIPKTAGTSLFRALEGQGCIKLKTLGEITASDPRGGFVTFGHVSVQALIKRRLLDHEYYLKAKKFTFVRCPYDRAVSLFYYLRDKRQEGRKNPGVFQSLESFLSHLTKGGHSRIGLYNARNFSQCRPQTDWTSGIDLDFVGRVERFDEDLLRLSQSIGLQPLQTFRENKSNRPAGKLIISTEAKEMIEEIYREDFSAFGYTFEGGASIEISRNRETEL